MSTKHELAFLIESIYEKHLKDLTRIGYSNLNSAFNKFIQSKLEDSIEGNFKQYLETYHKFDILHKMSLPFLTKLNQEVTKYIDQLSKNPVELSEKEQVLLDRFAEKAMVEFIRSKKNRLPYS